MTHLGLLLLSRTSIVPVPTFIACRYENKKAIFVICDWAAICCGTQSGHVSQDFSDYPLCSESRERVLQLQTLEL